MIAAPATAPTAPAPAPPALVGRSGRPVYPNLVQRPPRGLEVRRRNGRWLLSFTSLVDNRGPGTLRIRAERPARSRLMPVQQLLDLAGGGTGVVAGAGELAYVATPPHVHWHYLGFERYELRAASFAVVARDRKQGSCLSDEYGTVPGMAHGPPRFASPCARGRPGAGAVVEGLSVGYSDIYLARFPGQSLDVTTLAAGRYWLVNRTNPGRRLRELRYDDDAAAVLLRLTWPRGHASSPRFVVLRTCDRERC